MRKTYIENNELSVFADYIKSFDSLELESEIVPVEDALGRVLKCAVFAKKCDPMYNAAAMDGIAVISGNTLSASEKNPLTIYENKDFVYVNTGNTITCPYNAVIMIEDVIDLGNGQMQIIQPAYPWQHIRVKGESIVEGEMVLPSRSVLRPVDLGAIYASANMSVEVFKRPKLGIIPTGAEMVNNVKDLGYGKIMESNSKMFLGLAKEYNAIPKVYCIVKDDIAILEKTLEVALSENDIVIINAGSAAGTKDFTIRAIEKCGKVFAHGMAIKPGRPTILGSAGKKPVIGIPGYPVSANIAFDYFVKPFLHLMQGMNLINGNTAQAYLARTVNSGFRSTEIIRVVLGDIHGKMIAVPLERGASQIMSLVKADGLLKIDRLTEGIKEGENVTVELLKPLSFIKKKLVINGSHDLIIDIIGDRMPISSANLGSMGGIFALLRGECHIAPIHLLDEESGIYNISYIKKYFKGKKMALIKGVGRSQGILLRQNDNRIRNFHDLVNNNYVFANRQKGSGTRMLADRLLKLNGISVNDVNGYEKEYTTHLAVAVAVESGAADAALGIKSVAKINGLDFIEAGCENYDFLTYEEYLKDQRVERFIQLLSDKSIIESIANLGDYTVENIGEVELIEC